MDTAKTQHADEVPEGMVVPPTGDESADAGPAWEQIESGRYMPRRIRGSCRGRVLG